MFHRLSLMGHLGADATVRNVDNENTVINFNIADSRKYIDKETGEETEKTQWFSCSYWVKNKPKVAKFLKKGTLVYVEGNASADIFIDKTNKPQAQIKLKVFDLKLLKVP